MQEPKSAQLGKQRNVLDDQRTEGQLWWQKGQHRVFLRTQRWEAFHLVQWGADNELICWTETRVPFPAGLLTTLVQSREHMGSLYSLPPKELPANKLFWVAAPLPSSSLRCVARIWGGPWLPLDASINKVLVISTATLRRFPCADKVRR